jgi:hypothetical protein
MLEALRGPPSSAPSPLRASRRRRIEMVAWIARAGDPRGAPVFWYPPPVLRRPFAAWLPRLCLSALALAASADAHAFPHVVKKGETLARIAERTYGKVEMEQILVAANGLDAGGGIPIVAGMRLEVPAVSHRRVSAGETWASLAAELLGDPDRGDVLAMANGAMPWIPPADGQEILVPYNLRVIAGQHDSLLTIAYRYLGERDKAWTLDRYNHLRSEPIRRGDVVLVPLTDLPLTAEGRAEAANAGALVRAEGAGTAREAQRRAEAELPLLSGDVRAGRYVDAAARGNRMLGYGELARPQIAAIQRQLTEAYVALDAAGLAETACAGWREADPAAVLDPIELSPKILRACVLASVTLSDGAPAPSGVQGALGAPAPSGVPGASGAPRATAAPRATGSTLIHPPRRPGGRR